MVKPSQSDLQQKVLMLLHTRAHYWTANFSSNCGSSQASAAKSSGTTSLPRKQMVNSCHLNTFRSLKVVTMETGLRLSCDQRNLTKKTDMSHMQFTFRDMTCLSKQRLTGSALWLDRLVMLQIFAKSSALSIEQIVILSMRQTFCLMLISAQPLNSQGRSIRTRLTILVRVL